MIRTIAIFSNPFGYGPTGNAIPILRSLFRKIKDIDIIFVGSNLCLEIISDTLVKKVVLDERNQEEIEKFLGTLDNPHVIGSQNRFCIKAAKKLQIPCAFLDVLAWFWEKIPPDHLLADEIFWINFPGIKNKIPPNQNNIHIVSGIISSLPRKKSKKNHAMMHIGGAKYPLSESLPYAYLDLIAKGLNALKKGKRFDAIIFTGGSQAINYLKHKVTNKKVRLASLVEEKFIQELSQSSHMLTTAGVSSTFESFSLNIPTSFLLPLNLSQIALLDILFKNDCAPNYLIWDNYVKVNNNLRSMTEKDALAEINEYAKIVAGNKRLSNRFSRDFDDLTTLIPESSKQVKLIESIGNSGADEVVDILIKKWELPETIYSKNIKDR